MYQGYLRLSLAFFICLYTTCAKADVRLPALVSSKMVLQQRSLIKLWGWADAGEKVHIKVSWQQEAYDAITSDSADWMVKVPTPAAGGPYLITITGKNEIVLQDVLIGEVWLCSGQSNMDWCWISSHKSLEGELPVCRNDQVRFFRMPAYHSATEQYNVAARWEPCDSNSIKDFSAVGYYFGKKLYEQLHVPVGLIHSCMAATGAEFWTPAAAFGQDSLLAAKAPATSKKGAGTLFNSMIAPLKNLTIAGTIWYQGESDVANYSFYAPMFKAMISSWRKAFDQVFPFYFVQIAPFEYWSTNSAYFREAQASALLLPATGMVVISDLVNDVNDQHPVNKKGVGLRLADMALIKTYQQKRDTGLFASYDRLEIKGNKAIVYFKDVQTALLIKGKRLNACFVAGEDRQFRPAYGTLKNGCLVVSSHRVSKPVAVRYQFSNTGIGNLFSSNGLPVMPFRTDEF